LALQELPGIGTAGALDPLVEELAKPVLVKLHLGVNRSRIDHGGVGMAHCRVGREPGLRRSVIVDQRGRALEPAVDHPPRGLLRHQPDDFRPGEAQASEPLSER